jgi:multidrug efflux system outer membrane protein
MKAQARQWLFIVLASAGLLAGCAVGPDYKRPPTTPPETFRGQTGPAEAASLADLPWWEVFRDATLQELLQTALANNYDLRVAVARVEQARALAARARGEFLPAIGYEGNIGRARGAEFGAITVLPGVPVSTESAFLGLITASWEPDIWGRIRRQYEAARAQFLGTEEARLGVLLSLVSNVAQAYFELLQLDAQLDIARRNTASFQDTFNLFQRRLGFGLASTLETSRAEGALGSAAGTIPDFERQIAAKENEISVLLGRNPGPISRGTPLFDQPVVPAVPAGLPSALLERRPDLRQAEQQLVQANAQVGVAVANFFPQIILSGFGGGVSPELSGISTVWSLTAGLTGPIFQGGRIRANYQASVAAWEQAKLQYEQAVITAFQEVASALTALEKLAQVEAEQARAVKAYTDAVQIANSRYRGGLASYYEVLEAQQLLFPAETQLAQIRGNRLATYVQLYKVLGGGWSFSDAQWNGPQAQAQRQEQ